MRLKIKTNKTEGSALVICVHRVRCPVDIRNSINAPNLHCSLELKYKRRHILNMSTNFAVLNNLMT